MQSIKEKLYAPLFKFLNNKGITYEQIIVSSVIVWFSYRLITVIKYWGKKNPSINDRYDYLGDIIMLIGLCGFYYYK